MKEKCRTVSTWKKLIAAVLTFILFFGGINIAPKEMEEVMYVSNRAITRSGTKSYVKVKDDKGNVKTQEVVTGFSDGVNVEIVEGLGVGDVVLIESKVAGE